MLHITDIVGLTSYATNIFYIDKPNNFKFIDLAGAFVSCANQLSLIVFILLNADEFDYEEDEISDSSCSSCSSISDDDSSE